MCKKRIEGKIIQVRGKFWRQFGSVTKNCRINNLFGSECRIDSGLFRKSDQLATGSSNFDAIFFKEVMDSKAL